MRLLRRLSLIGTCTILTGVMAGCAATRVTTTPRTPVEQALVSQSVKPIIDKVQVKEYSGKSFTIVDAELVSPDKETILSELRQRLLEDGLVEAKDPEAADLKVYSRAEYSGVDDANFILGIPSIPIPLGNITINTPEIAIFAKDTQVGRNKLGVYALREEDGGMEFMFEPPGEQRKYTRWRFLLFFNFRTTNLKRPF